MIAAMGKKNYVFDTNVLLHDPDALYGFEDNNVVGFGTFGEQFQAMHVNQTFTGVAIGIGMTQRSM